VKFGLGIKKVLKQTHRQQGDLISLLLFLKNKESMAKILLKLKLGSAFLRDKLSPKN
jgi:hypothetical protein